MRIKKSFIGILIFLTSISIYSLDNKFGGNNFELIQKEKEQIKSLNDLILWVDDIKNYFLSVNKSRELVEYLGQIAINEKKIQYASYLYFIISDIYWINDNKEVSVYYMTKIEENSYNILYTNQPIGYLIALRIIGFECNFKFQEKMYKLLLTKYKEKIDILYTMNDLVRLYKNQLDMQSAIKVMEDILLLAPKYKNIEESINLSEIKQEVKFFYLKKIWIYKDIKYLIKNIKNAIRQKDINLLKSYISKNGFEIIFFQKTNQNKWSFDELRIETHFADNIVFMDKFEDFSNDDEIYLRSDNWNFPQMTTWFFYFKRVNYPFDERIDGGWEWKGIYFGELF